MLNFELLFQLRLVIARYGEMDGARWWNTQGILGQYGALALSRGFPKTHRFAQAIRAAFQLLTKTIRAQISRPRLLLHHLRISGILKSEALRVQGFGISASRRIGTVRRIISVEKRILLPVQIQQQ